PSADPNFVYVYLNMPVGTDQAYTNTVLQKLEHKVYNALDIDLAKNKKNDIVKSVISNVTVGAVDPSSGEIGEFPNKGRIAVAFVKFEERHGESTYDYLEKIRNAVKDVPGAEVTVDKESSGPPLPKPIVINITGDNLDSLVSTSERLKRFIESKKIDGIEELRSDFQASKPEIVFDLDRERMNDAGVNTYMVVSNLRTAVFGKEVSRFRDANDDYPITLRLKEEQRTDVDGVRNMPLIFRNSMGQIMKVPISTFTNVRYDNTYGGIKRQDLKRIITLSSNVVTGNNENQVVKNIETELKNFKAPNGVNITMGGQQEDQAETMSFLSTAMGIAIMLIFLLLII